MLIPGDFKPLEVSSSFHNGGDGFFHFERLSEQHTQVRVRAGSWI